MDGGIIIFITSFVLLVAALVVIIYNTSVTPAPVPETASGIPNPNSSWIGAQCPVGCTCFPNTGATMSSDKPTQKCAYLSNDVMFDCPAECCQPTCINQDVPNFAVRSV